MFVLGPLVGPTHLRSDMYAQMSDDSVASASTPPAMDKTSAVCRRLRQLVINKPIPITPVAAATSNNKGKYEILVDNFKKKSSSSGFRSHIQLYKKTVQRLADAGEFSHIDDILQHQKQYPDIKEEHFTSRLIILYGKAKMLDHALKLFDEMPDLNCPRTVFSFNALLHACFLSSNYDKALELFEEVPRLLSIEPNAISYTAAIEALCRKELFDKAISMVDEMETKGFEPDIVTFNVVLGRLYYNGRFMEAEKTWNMMREKKVVPDLRCCNSRIYGLVGEKRFSEAVEMVRELEQKELNPNAYTYNLLIKGYIDEGNVDEVKKWYAALRESKTAAPDSFTYVPLIPFAQDHIGIDHAFELCKNAVALTKRKISKKMIAKVVDELRKQSKDEEAKELLHLYHMG